jgi:hypothetical protein
MGMSDDAAVSSVAMFGGRNHTHDFGDTWTWDGTTWTQQHPAVSPAPREGLGLAYDAARNVLVAFGGEDLARTYFGDTWTWDGGDWRVPFVAHLHLSPASGPPGSMVTTTGNGFAAFEDVTITFIDSVNGKTNLGTFTTDSAGGFDAAVTIPANATQGVQKLSAVGAVSRQKAKATFTVT